MKTINELYKHSLVLLTDLYQLTMAYGYWKEKMADNEAVFHLFFRKHPFKGGYTLACGLAYVCAFLENFQFDDESLEYLATLEGNDGKPVFEKAFLDYLRSMKFSCNVDAVPEGTAVFPQEPLIRMEGPLIQCQLLETALLNIINFQTLIATKAARICYATGGEPVLEFGLRRAQGIDGALAASRASFIGGCSATSNVLAGKLFDIPVKGTHAHSWVMCFDKEIDSFRAYAEAMPNNCVFLVDTYDTVGGVRHAIEVGKELRKNGHEMVGIRLDSGDLAYLSIKAREMLDEAGFPNAAIVASNDLDERVISSLKQQGATIGVWGVGTKLATAYEQPALGGVYKLAAIREPQGRWIPKVKLSEQAVKTSTPGPQQVRRYWDNHNCGDVIYNVGTDISQGCIIVDPLNPMRRKKLSADLKHEDLLIPIYRHGKLIYTPPSAKEVRERVKEQMGRFHGGVKRLVNPHEYPAGLEKSLYDLKMKLILEARGFEE